MLLGKGPLGDLLYPLYFKAHVGTFVVPSECKLSAVWCRPCCRSSAPLAVHWAPSPCAACHKCIWHGSAT